MTIFFLDFYAESTGIIKGGIKKEEDRMYVGNIE